MVVVMGDGEGRLDAARSDGFVLDERMASCWMSGWRRWINELKRIRIRMSSNGLDNRAWSLLVQLQKVRRGMTR